MKDEKVSLNLLRPAELKEGIKSGLGTKHFCGKYECTEEALKQRVGAIFRKSPKIVRSIMADLKANDKKLEKKAAAQSIKVEARDEKKKAEIITDKNEEATVPPRTMTRAEQLEALRAAEIKKSDQVIELETSHKKLAGEHKKRIKRLRELKKDIDEIELTLKGKCREYEDIVLENNNLVQKMNAISQERRGKVMQLDEIRQQIEDLDRIEICVYSDGTIAPIEEQPLSLDESGSDELYATLIEDERCQNLRLNSIRALAKILKIVENSIRKIDILFEDADLESVFYDFL